MKILIQRSNNKLLVTSPHILYKQWNDVSCVYNNSWQREVIYGSPSEDRHLNNIYNGMDHKWVLSSIAIVYCLVPHYLNVTDCSHYLPKFFFFSSESLIHQVIFPFHLQVLIRNIYPNVRQLDAKAFQEYHPMLTSC